MNIGLQRRRNHPRRIAVAMLLVFASPLPAQSAPATAGASHAKKVIYYGWGTRDTRYVRRNWQAMEQMPLDGIGINVAIDRKKPSDGDETTPNLFGWNLFGPNKHSYDNFAPAVADLQAAKWRKFTDNFLAACISSSGQDFSFNWFDDARWQTVLHNWDTFVRIARAGGCKGIMLDPEHYGARFFNYPLMAKRANKSYPEYVQQVRTRGQDLMRVVRKHYPDDFTLFCLFGHTLVWNYVSDESRSKVAKDVTTAEYALYPALLDGMLEAAGPAYTVVDGYEFSYGFEDLINFERAHKDIMQGGVRVSSVPDLYRKHVQVGFGLWIDYGGAARWSARDFGKNHFSPDIFSEALSSACKVSDRYVWIYSQRVGFFPPGQLPDAYLKGMRTVAAEQSSRKHE